MRVHRIHVRNFKGVDDRELELITEGVTIVEGPNEIGKTSLAEALVLALEQPDSSTRAEIRAARPVHVDAGPWVEVELTTGPYRLVIEKRWLKSPMTHLRVTAPRAEELTGREAHDRLRAILSETLDEQLFRALHFEQGVQLRQAALGECPSLAAALDASASGQLLGGQHEVSLVELIDEERLRYFTPTVRPTAERSGRAAAITALRDSIATVRAELDKLDTMGDEHRSLLEEARELNAALAEAQQSALDEGQLWATIQGEQLRVANLRSVALVARSEAENARGRVEQRAMLRDAVEGAESAARAAQVAVEGDQPVVAAARLALEDAKERRELARQSVEQAERAVAEARRSVEYLDAAIALDLWTQRRDRARTGRETLEAADRTLATNPMDAKRLKAIEAASARVDEARITLSASSASIAVEALGSVTVRTPDKIVTLGAGEVFESVAAGKVQLQIGDVARVTVTGGASERELEDGLRRAEEALAELLNNAGLAPGTTLAACQLAFQERRDAAANKKRAEELIEDNLRDLSIEQVESKVVQYEAILRSYRDEHGDDAPQLDQATARHSLVESEAALSARRRELTSAETALDGAREQESKVAAEVQGRVTALEVATSKHSDAAAALESARGEAADSELDEGARAAREVAESAEAELSEADAQLALLDPVSVETRLNNATALTERLNGEIDRVDRRIVELRTLLASKGEQGLYDQLNKLLSDLEVKEREHGRLERQAAAALLLWTTVVAKREAAQRAYVSPYRTEVERLGRLAYGPDFAVEVDHATLSIESRTLGGRTVRFDQLSTGAREQLCLIALLACATIVTAQGQGGAPVIIDDALGSSDRGRLQRLGAVIAAASSGCQIVILTCEPGRYRNVGSAVSRQLR